MIPYRTSAWYRKQSDRYYEQKANKAVAEYIRLSRTHRSLSHGTVHAELLAAYNAGDVEKVASILRNSRDAQDAFDGGGGYNLIRSNSIGYAQTHMPLIGRLLSKAPAKPRARKARSNPRGIPAIKHNSVWQLRRPTFAGEETRVYVREVPREGYDRVVFRSYSGRDGGMTEASFCRQYKPVRGAR